MQTFPSQQSTTVHKPRKTGRSAVQSGFTKWDQLPSSVWDTVTSIQILSQVIISIPEHGTNKDFSIFFRKNTSSPVALTNLLLTILGFARHRVSVVTIQLCCYIRKVVTNLLMNGHGWVPTKLYHGHWNLNFI